MDTSSKRNSRAPGQKELTGKQILIIYYRTKVPPYPVPCRTRPHSGACLISHLGVSPMPTTQMASLQLRQVALDHLNGDLPNL